MIDVTEQEIRKDGQRQGVPMEFTEAMIWAWKEGKISPVERDETDGCLIWEPNRRTR